MDKDTADAIDGYLLSNGAAVPGVRPPGLFVGMSTSASTGNTLQAILTDIETMVGHVTANKARDPVWIMNDARVRGLGRVTNATGQFVFRDEVRGGTFEGYPILTSMNVPTDIVALVDAADFRSAFDAPGFLASDQATIVEADAEDGTPPYIAENVIPPAGAITSVDDAVNSTPPAPVRSLYQTDTLALRMIMPLSWHQFRPASSYVHTAVAW
jgi:hypothetical protein